MPYVIVAALTMLFMVSVLFGPPAAVQPHWRYASYVARHKWFVLVAGIRLGPPAGVPLLRYLRWWLQLLVHDWTKLLPSEWTPYVDYFYGPPVEGCEKCKKARQAAFDVAWLHHQHRNSHHWQRWLLRLDKPGELFFSLPGHRLREYYLYDKHPSSSNHLGTLQLVYGEDTYQRHAAMVALLNSHPRPLPMPERYAREMVADWMGAGRAITGRWETPTWYAQNRHNMVLHPDTRAYVEQNLGISFVADGRMLAPVYDPV